MEWSGGLTPVAGLGNDVSLDCRGAVSSRSAAATLPVPRPHPPGFRPHRAESTG